MLKCWNSDPKERPSFSALVNSISGFAEKTAGYLDVSNYNPFEANITTSEEGCDGDRTEQKPATNTGVPLDNPPVETNLQCPSEDEGLHDDSSLWQFFVCDSFTVELDPVINTAFLRPSISILLYEIFDILIMEFAYVTILFVLNCIV